MKRKIVCLCGSTRFSDAYRKANLEETLKGNIVLTVGSMTHSDAQLQAIGYITDEQKIELDELHKDKITMADEILVLNVKRCTVCGAADEEPTTWPNHPRGGGHACAGTADRVPYIGESTKSEIAHAKRLGRGKRIRFLNPQGPVQIVDHEEHGEPIEEEVQRWMREELGLT